MKAIFRHTWAWLFCWSLLLLAAACSDDTPVTPPDNPSGGGEDDNTEWVSVDPAPDTWDEQRRAGITYQLLVYSFADSDGDGWGDLRGVTDKLDYLQQLGVSALWLSPIHPAMSYHGYDVTDYTAVNPRLGTLADFDRLLSEAHSRGIKIYLDYVLNHTGKDHPWFIAAKESEDNEYRDYYTFSQDPATDIAAGRIPMIASEGTNGYNAGEWFNATAADILFSSQVQWKYHSAFFTDWFADLNYGPANECASSPAYQAIASAARGWVERGVDGFRLDAVKHIYHNARSDENPRFLAIFYDDMNDAYHAAGHADDIYMVGEVLSEHNEVAPYYAGLPALFEFSFWYRLEWAINNGQGYYFAKDLLDYRAEYAAVRSDYVAATKLTNHDEDRAASLLGRNMDKCRLAAAVLLTAQGTPYIYYGEELGLYGTKGNGDEYVRGPMLWGDAYTTAYTDKVDAGVEANVPSVSAQQADASSLLNTYHDFIRLRNTYPALATGTMSRHAVYNETNEAYPTLAAWVMTQGNERLLVFHNFGSSAIELPLTDTIRKAVGTQGTVEQAKQDGKTLVRLGGYSSAVYLLE